ncbi:MAG: hypothetical protein HFJ33_02615 [Clostridia bacterium]|nr:hypothetical protein [Clostridia bacterium]
MNRLNDVIKRMIKEARTTETKPKKKRNKEKGLVVDTSSLNKNGALEFIMGHSTVILTVDVVREMDKYKSERSIFGKNIRQLLAESAKDKYGKKIKVEITKKVSKYTDENLLAFCKRKDVILYTADNGLATLARAYNIEYLLAEDILVEQKEKETKMNSNSIMKQELTINNTSKWNGRLILTIPKTYKIWYVVLSEKNKVKNCINNKIYLEKNDVVLVMTYKENKINISRYKIINIKEVNHARYLENIKISNIDQIEKLDLSEDVRKEIHKYFSLIRNEITNI